MFVEKGYQSYEEFEREELRKLDRIDLGVDDLLGEFDQDHVATRRAAREGLFDTYDSDEQDDYSYDD